MADDSTRGVPEMACKELVELVTDYLEGALSTGERRRFEEHLKGCIGCRNYLEQMRQVIHSTGKLDEDSIPEPAKNELLYVFRDWKKSR